MVRTISGCVVASYRSRTVSNSPSRQRGTGLCRRKQIDKNASHCRFVCNLDWLQLPCAAARESGNVHFTGLFSRTAASTLIESKRAPFRPEPRTKTVQNVAVAAKPTPAKSVEGRQHPVTTDPTLKKATTTIGGKTEDLSDQSSEISDPVLKKAKITIAGKMENPASAEFVDMRRATRKNTFGQPIDTICGHVKGKKASGKDTGKQPFLYLVKDDEAYVVDANTPNAVAATAYRNICTSPNAQ
jgi:hypothetical protein